MEKEKKIESYSSLVFAVNGERFEISSAEIDPSITLLQFLRTQTSFKSVKLSCGEGGCGACVVLVSKYNQELGQVEHFTASSCLTLLYSINGNSITTSEGLGNSTKGFHPIHQRFSGFHASQCGFCTPGMCMSFFGTLINSENNPSKLSAIEAEKAIAGNLCRCTGYRPIADACKSFASDIDMEDLGFNSFWKKGDSKEVKMSKIPSYNHNHNLEICSFPEFLKGKKHSLVLNSSWHQPGSLEELQRLLNNVGNGPKFRTKLVVGNTGTGYYKELEEPYEKYINLRYVSELSMIRKDGSGIEIGATVTISKVIDVLRQESGKDFVVFDKLADHMEKVANKFVRNTGSIGGNLVMAQRKGFPSDIATILLAVGSYVDVIATTSTMREKLSLEEFLEGPPLDSKSILLSVTIPNFQEKSDGRKCELVFETFRAAPRPLGSALAYLNAGFLAEVSESYDGKVLKDCKLAFGAFGTKNAIRARKVEEFLARKVLTIDVLCEAIKLVKATVVSEDGTPYPEYRTSLAVGFLFKFLLPLSSNGILNEYKLDNVKSPSLLSSSKQVIQINKEYDPVGQPIVKTGSTLQASGEAVYVDDIPAPKNCLYGAFIYSTKPLAKVKSIHFNSESLPEGVLAVISFKDIPKNGQNIGTVFLFGPEPLFAEEITQYAGEPLAFVIADTQKRADLASKLAVVEYEIENLPSPILTVEEAVERSSLFEVPPMLYPNQIGDVSKGMAVADHKILSAELKLGSQYYFYMENQTALAVPDEDNCMVVYSSTQNQEFAHTAIAKCLGVPEHNVRVITRRVGGGFGGKAVKSMPFATACALAAHKLKRPVRVYLNRHTDMIMVGGRHPMKITYNVGFKSNGKLTALDLQILIDAGIFIDMSPIMPKAIVASLKKYDWGALSFDIKVCKTNTLSKSAMRAPGDLQGSYIAEAIIEHVAAFLSTDSDSIRAINLHTYDSLKLFYDHCAGEPPEYTLTLIWNKLASNASIKQRVELIKEFNKSNLWKKRGISQVPCVYEVGLRPTPGKVSIMNDGSIVVEVGGLEIGQGLWTKVKQTVAFGLGSIGCDGAADELLDKIRVLQSDTLSLIQGGITAGSTTSESSCEAVRLCCNVLVERLMVVKEKLLAQMLSIKWENLISQAYLESVHLSVNSYFVPEFASSSYLNYGAAVSEVEIDLLTGQTTVLRTDILYDCGRSLNPAVDLGQIEGAFVQGIGFFMNEEYTTNPDGLMDAKGTWTYKIPTMDTIPKQFNVELLNTGHHQNRVLSSKASGEPPLLLAASIHCAARAAIHEARRQVESWSHIHNAKLMVQMDVPATMPIVKKLCGVDIVERYLQWKRNGN